MCWIGFLPRRLAAEEPVAELLYRLAMACGAPPGWLRVHSAWRQPVPRSWMKRGVVTPKRVGTRPWRCGGDGGPAFPAATAAAAIAYAEGSSGRADLAALDAVLDAEEALPLPLRRGAGEEAIVIGLEGRSPEPPVEGRLGVLAALVLPPGFEAEALRAAGVLAAALPRRLRGRGLRVHRVIAFNQGASHAGEGRP